jgi:PKD repeat protein
MKTSSFSIRLDERIIFSMVIVCVLASFITAFRFKNDKPCPTYDFGVSANDYMAGRYVFFSTTGASNAEKWEWNFGDNTPVDKFSGPNATHIFKQAGNYDITLTINGKCTQVKSISINSVSQDSIPQVIPQILLPQEPILTNQTVMFRDMTNGSNKWEWFIGEGVGSKQFTTKDVVTSFSRTGEYKIKLVVNGNYGAVLEKTVRVTSLPSSSIPSSGFQRAPISIPDGPPPSRIPQGPRNPGVIPDAPPSSGGAITDPKNITKPKVSFTKEHIQEMIQGVIDGSYVEQDFYPYMCGNKNVRVLYNKEDISFHEAIEKLQSARRLKSVKPTIFTDEITGCINRMSIITKKKWL